MKVYVLSYEFESWTDQGKEILSIHLTHSSAYDSMIAEANARGWKDRSDEKWYKVTDNYVMNKQDWEIVRTLQIGEYEVKN